MLIDVRGVTGQQNKRRAGARSFGQCGDGVGDCGTDGDAAQLARELGMTISPTKVTYGTESGIYEAAGMSAVVIGPGDIAQAHGANEYVDLEQIDKCEAFFLALLENLSAS